MNLPLYVGRCCFNVCHSRAVCIFCVEWLFCYLKGNFLSIVYHQIDYSGLTDCLSHLNLTINLIGCSTAGSEKYPKRQNSAGSSLKRVVRK